MSLVVIELRGVYTPASDSYSMAVEVHTLDFSTDPTTNVCLKMKHREILALDHVDPPAALRGLLEEGLSAWRFRVRCADPF